MDKIIINNVNVSECEFYSKRQRILTALNDVYVIDNACSLHMHTVGCDGKDCYYKQLQRLKADMLYIRKIAQKLRTKTDYHSPDEVNNDIDLILDKTKEV